jgi:AcrR family transcriptional regulator
LVVLSAGDPRVMHQRSNPVAAAGARGRQRARILAAATEIICEGAASSLSVAQLAARAGVSARTFTNLFSDPRTCLVEAFEDAVTLASRRASVAYNAHEDWLERIRAALGALLGFADERPELARLCILHAPSGPAPLVVRCREHTDMLAKTLERDAPCPTPDSVRPWTAHAVIGAVLGAIHARLARDAGQLMPMRNQLVATIILPYLGPDAAACELAR